LFNRVPKYQKLFQKTFPYICNDCGEFTSNQYEFCEKCGAENSVRKAMIEDYTKYYLKKEKEKSRSERRLSDDQPENLKLLAFLFTFFLIFLTFEIPFLINSLLIQMLFNKKRKDFCLKLIFTIFTYFWKFCFIDVFSCRYWDSRSSMVAIRYALL
jgi:hypothetical protein